MNAVITMIPSTLMPELMDAVVARVLKSLVANGHTADVSNVPQIVASAIHDCGEEHSSFMRDFQDRVASVNRLSVMRSA